MGTAHCTPYACPTPHTRTHIKHGLETVLDTSQPCPMQTHPENSYICVSCSGWSN